MLTLTHLRHLTAVQRHLTITLRENNIHDRPQI
jgi:hypothetical protein